MTSAGSPTPEERLERLGLSLPSTPAPVAVYVPAVRVGAAIYTSGQLPTIDGTLMAEGIVGGGVDVETATACARRAALNAVAAIRDVLGGDLSEVKQVARVGVFVASDPSFTGQAQVANGASELLGALFGDIGQHARSAVGVAALPFNAPVEVEVTVQV